jgi:hypothetical protein
MQEGVASNHVFVFEWKAGQHNYTHSAEVKSILEKTTRNSSKLHVYLQKPRGAQHSATERVIRYDPHHLSPSLPIDVSMHDNVQQVPDTNHPGLAIVTRDAACLAMTVSSDKA